MQDTRGYGVSLLVALLAVLSSGRETVTKYACLGETTEVFKDIIFDSGIEEVSLYRNGLWSSIIATWHKKNNTVTFSTAAEYKQRIFLDEYGSIWIRNIQLYDEAKYFIKQVIYSSPVTTEMHVYVLAPPNNHCRPNIMHVDNVLTVYLNSKDCGTPVPHVRWLDHPGISQSSNTFAKLRPGKEAGTYYACSEGPALRCLKTSTALDFCSAFTIARSNSPLESLEIPDMTTITTLLVAIVVLIPVVAIITLVVGILCKRHLRKYQRELKAEINPNTPIKRLGSFKRALSASPPSLEEITLYA